jgi:ribose transport system permease protein
LTTIAASSRWLLRHARREPAVPAVYIVLAIMVVVYAVLDPSILNSDRATIVLAEKLPLVLAVVGQTIVFLTRGIDLSVGGIVTLTNVVIATQMGQGFGGIAIGVAIGLLVGIAAGVANGCLVGLVRLPPIIATLATWSILEGLALYVLPQPGGSVPIAFGDFPLRTFFSIPFPLILMVVLPLIFWGPVRYSRLGHAIYAVGSDEQAAYMSGLSVAFTKIVAYAMSGFFAALAGVFLTMQALSGDPRIGESFTLDSIAATVLGGTLLAGGRGGVLGPIAGALVLGLLSDLLFFTGARPDWEYVISGAVLVIALVVSTLGRRISGEQSR